MVFRLCIEVRPYAEVRFDGLEVFIYWSQGQPQVGARATGIHLVNPKT